jgi:hypothetical protein
VQAGPRGDALAYFLFHSRGLGALSRQTEAKRQLLESEYDPRGASIWLADDDIPYRSLDLELKGQSVLDLLMYYDHLFVASTEGLWSTLLVTDGRDARHRAGLRKRLEYPCTSASASMGAIAVSCGDEGLTVLLDEFSWIGSEHRSVKLSDVSFRVAYATTGLVNYWSRTGFQLLSGEVDERSKKRTFVGFTKTGFGREDLLRQVSPLLDASDQKDLEFADNVRSTFVVLVAGRIVTVPMRTDKETGERHFQAPRVRGEYSGRLVSAEILEGDVFLETQHGIVVLPRDLAPERAYEGLVTSLRVFPRSKRYRQLALIVGGEGLVLMPSLSSVAAAIAFAEDYANE